MDKFPIGKILGKWISARARLKSLRIPLYAANACYFLVLAVFPGLLLLLSLLRYTPMEVGRLGQMLQGLLPEAFLRGTEHLILRAYENTTGTVVGISAVTALWSASQGVYGVLTGLNAVYGVEEDRGYVYTRLISVGYTFAFLLVVLLTLTLSVYGQELLDLLENTGWPGVGLLGRVVNGRSFLLLAIQTGFFTAMFMVLPNRRNGLGESLPGALLASAGWLLFSKLYSVYVERFASLTNVFGSVYALALSMLWLYFCMSIVFYGGALNALVIKGKKWV